MGAHRERLRLEGRRCRWDRLGKSIVAQELVEPEGAADAATAAESALKSAIAIAVVVLVVCVVAAMVLANRLLSSFVFRHVTDPLDHSLFAVSFLAQRLIVFRDGRPCAIRRRSVGSARPWFLDGG